MKTFFRRLASNFNYDLRFFCIIFCKPLMHSFGWIGILSRKALLMWSVCQIRQTLEKYDLKFPMQSMILTLNLKALFKVTAYHWPKALCWWDINHFGPREKNTVYPVIFAMIYFSLFKRPISYRKLLNTQKILYHFL